MIHPGAGKPEKCWPIERFVELTQRLQRARRAVRILLGEAELEKWPSDAIASVERVASVRRPHRYLDLLAELSTASIVVGNDSGPGHLAGIIGVRTISLFGTDPTRWKPIGPRIRVVHESSLDQISVKRVLTAINE